MIKKFLSIGLVFILCAVLIIPAYATYTDGPSNMGYNRTDAAAYVAAYTRQPNNEYMNYDSLGGDCTNFASQVLVAGGLEMTEPVENPVNSTSWYYYYDSAPGLGRTSSWTGAHQFREYWADVNGQGGKHAYEFIKYTAGDFDDDSIWYEIYEYLEPGDIVQYVYGSNGETYHTQIVHRTSYENSEYKVSMGQHSPFSWANLRNYVSGLSDSTIVCLIKIKRPSYRSSVSMNMFGLHSQSTLCELQNDVYNTNTNSDVEEEQKWAEYAAIKHEMVSKAKTENYSYKAAVTIDTLFEFIETRINNNEQIIAAYSDNNTQEAKSIIDACKQENTELLAYRSVLSKEEPCDNVFELWQYYWEELLHEDAPSYFIP